MPFAPDIEAATVYTQTWLHRPNGIMTGIEVLALHQEMAEEMGGIELANRDCHLMDWTLTENIARPEASDDRKRAILANEDAECAELRENSFRDRENLELLQAEQRQKSVEGIAYENALNRAGGRY